MKGDAIVIRRHTKANPLRRAAGRTEGRHLPEGPELSLQTKPLSAKSALKTTTCQCGRFTPGRREGAAFDGGRWFVGGYTIHTAQPVQYATDSLRKT